MSESGTERSNFRGGGGGGSSGGDDGDDDDEKKRRRYGWGRNLDKAKQVVLFPFRKVKKQLVYSGRRRSRSRSSSSSATCLGRAEGFLGCSLCFKPPQTVESPAYSQTSDPNNPAFTYEHLKALIEKNDFYSKECNPHTSVPSFSD